MRRRRGRKLAVGLTFLLAAAGCKVQPPVKPPEPVPVRATVKAGKKAEEAVKEIAEKSRQAAIRMAKAAAEIPPEQRLEFILERLKIKLKEAEFPEEKQQQFLETVKLLAKKGKVPQEATTVYEEVLKTLKERKMLTGSAMRKLRKSVTRFSNMNSIQLVTTLVRLIKAEAELRKEPRRDMAAMNAWLKRWKDNHMQQWVIGLILNLRIAGVKKPKIPKAEGK